MCDVPEILSEACDKFPSIFVLENCDSSWRSLPKFTGNGAKKVDSN